MKNFDFDDTQTSGIWWSTYLAIKDALIELKNDTNCSNSEIVELLRNLAASIENDGL